MATLRDFARSAVSRAFGVSADPPAPPVVHFERVSPAVRMVSAEREAARTAAADSSADVVPAPISAPVPSRVELAPADGSDAHLAEALATIACGAQELRERIGAGEPVTVVDVREAFEVLTGTLPNALCIPLAELPARWKELENIDEVVCYCATGERSLEAARLLRENGLFNATSLEGGITAWMEVGGTVARPAAARGASLGADKGSG
jgi:rhodanese-related sulfurtransferase